MNEQEIITMRDAAEYLQVLYFTTTISSSPARSDTRRKKMSNLFVLKCKDEATGENMLGTLKRLQNQHLIVVEDAALVMLQPNGRPKIRQAHDLVGAGALGGAFWGMLVGLLFLSPFLGAAIGAGAGALAGKMSSVGSETLTGSLNDIGLNDEFIQRITNAIHPSEAALFLLTRDEVAEKVLPELKQYQFEVIQTSLSDENEAQLHEMLG
ncbi:MAG TPA: DUF1269 domain-containing protein [Ktedonobacteraceae bacterium]|nr:DUF1269 domain-containing protein [Ktedonobacteraceae bacterium]